MAPTDVRSDAYAKFSGRKNHVLATIVLSIDPMFLYLVGDSDDPVVVWQKLGDQFQKRMWANKLQLRKQLHSLYLKDASIQDHIKTMIEIFNKMAIVGVDITDEDRVVYLLASLPDSYNTLVTALEASANVPTLEVVTERLLHEERKKLERNGGGRVDGAMHARRRRHGGPRCYNCQKYGHIQCNCPQELHKNGKEERSHKSGDKERDAARHKVNQAEVKEIDSGSDVDTGLVTRHDFNFTGDITQPTNCWII